MIKKFLGLPLVAGVALLGGLSTPSNAATIYALNNANQIIGFDSAAPGTLTFGPATVTGLASSDSLANIDYRPATETIYGVGASHTLYEINISGASATASAVGPAGAFGITGTHLAFDVDPQLDRVRIMTELGENIRVNPNDGSLDSTDSTVSPLASIADLAYTRSYAGTASTALYAVDFVTDSVSFASTLYSVADPAAGALTAVGSGLGVQLSAAPAIDISGATLYAALKDDTGVTSLYTVNTASGAATLVGPIAGNPTILGLAAGHDQILPAVKVGIKLNFAKPLSDSVSLAGALLVPAGFNVAGAPVTVDVGGVEKTFTLDAKGKAKVGNDSFSIKVKAKKGVVLEQVAKFKFATKKGTFAPAFVDENFTSRDAKKEPGAVVGVVQVGDLYAQSTLPVLYTGKAGKSGSVK